MPAPRSPRRPFQGYVLLASLPLLAVASWLIFRDSSAKPASAALGVPVEVAVVEQRDVPFWADGIGSVAPLQDVVLRTRVTGVLAEVLFTEGQSVRKGQLLARIDDREYEAALLQAQAEKLRNEAQLKAAELDLQRYENLLREDAISRQTVDQQTATVSQMRAAVRANEAAIATAQVQLSYTRIVSPIDGRVGLRRIDPGNLVQPGDAQGLVTVTQIDPISVVFTLPQQQLAQIRHLIHTTTGSGTGEATAQVSAFDRDRGTALGEGRLTMIDNTIDTATGMIRLRAQFANADAQLWPGQFVTTRLHTGTHRNALVVPARSVRQGLDGAFVYRIKTDGERQTAEVVAVTPSYQDDEIAVIGNTLAAGERVVVDGYSRLKPGAVVSLAAAATATAATAGAAVASGP